jgi:multimeric flavodoxin WrbA
MKKVTAFVGTSSKKHTYKAVRQFLENLQSLGEVESEVIVLSDYKIGTCRGCKAAGSLFDSMAVRAVRKRKA